MTDPSALIWSTDPGWRFAFLCSSAKDKGHLFKRSIKNYSADEYWEVSSKLSKSILSPSPRDLAEAINGFADQHQPWKELMDEDQTFDFALGNFPIRVLLSRFTRIQKDKLTAPQFFCWPGMCLTSYRSPLDEAMVGTLFGEHQALFLNRPDLDVYPRVVPGRDESKLQRVMDTFYLWVAVYEMTRQWLVDSGPFEYDYNWLTSKYSKEETKSWADHHFHSGTGVHPDSFAILK